VLSAGRAAPVQGGEGVGASVEGSGFECMEAKSKAVEAVELEICVCMLADAWM